VDGQNCNKLSTIRNWAKSQITSWSENSIPYTKLVSKLSEISEANKDVFVFLISNGKVRFLRKSYIDTRSDPTLRFFSYRGALYYNFLTSVASRYKGLNCLIGISVDDKCTHNLDIPLFSFQKSQASKLFLLPDIDLLINSFYRDFATDPYDYHQKNISAIFVGSTTGSIHTKKSVESLENQRLRLAVFYKFSRKVTFNLPIICQTLDQDAEQAIIDLDVAGQRVSWNEKYQHRFLISVDGNGANCSRVALGLRSKSALIKFSSSYELFYFSGLRPLFEYIPADCPEDVYTIIDKETSEPGHFEHIATNGKAFFDKFLTRESCEYYTGELLLEYQKIFN